MPNHCDNRLYVRGDVKQLDEFMRQISTDNADKYEISSLVPMPEALVGTDSPTPKSSEPDPNWATLLAKGEMTQEWYDELVTKQKNRYESGQKLFAETGYRNWYDWAIQNWGTKWGDYNHYSVIRNDDGQFGIEIGYETAWSPFIPTFWEKVSAMFPDLEFVVVYEEPGMCFAGSEKYKNGETVFEACLDDYTKTLPEVDWDNDDSFEAFHQAKTDLLDQLYEQADLA